MIIGLAVGAVDIALYVKNPVLRDIIGGQAWIYYLYLSVMIGVFCWVTLTVSARVFGLLRRGSGVP